MVSLKEHIKSYSVLTEIEIDNILQSFYRVSLDINNHFLAIGEHCNEIAFIESGLARVYHINDQGEEVTVYFSKEGTFTTLHNHYNDKTKAGDAIQAITQTELLVIDRCGLENIFNTYPAFHYVVRKEIEKVATELTQKSFLLRELTADKRYEYLLKNEPFLIQNAPLNYIASFIGISPQHLSRIRRNSTH